jgi:hypothetical protein
MSSTDNDQAGDEEASSPSHGRSERQPPLVEVRGQNIPGEGDVAGEQIVVHEVNPAIVDQDQAATLSEQIQ